MNIYRVIDEIAHKGSSRALETCRGGAEGLHRDAVGRHGGELRAGQLGREGRGGKACGVLRARV